MRPPAVLPALLPVVLLLGACGGSPETAAPAPPLASGVPSPRPVVGSAVCEDLREVVRVREGLPELVGVTEQAAASAAVQAASRRVLVQLGTTQVVPEEVVQALRDLEGGAGPDDGLDATVAAYVDRACGG